MTALQHVYLTAHGEYFSGPYLGEAAQIGFRFGFAPVASSPIMGERFVLDTHGEAVPDFGTETTTNGVLTKSWKARVGPVSSVENWGGDEQAAAAEATLILMVMLKAYQSSAFKWTTVKQAAIDATGKTIGTASTWKLNSPMAGAGSSMLPAQSALAISSRANIVGRAGRGRFYLPALATTAIGTDGTVSDTVREACNTQFKNYVDAMQGILGGLDTMRAVYVITSAGAATAVRPAEVRTGHLVDTIRSRRAQVEETYSTLPL